MGKFPDNKIDLIYLDPPFFSNKHYEVIWKDGAEIRAFQDRWKGGIEHYISWMEPRLRECYRVLKDTGSIYLHCDYHANAHLRILMDSILKGNFRNEIIWHKKGGIKAVQKIFPRKYDSILFYTKSDNYTFNILRGDIEDNALYGRWIDYSHNGKTVLYKDFPRTDKVKFKDYTKRFIAQHGREPRPNDVFYEFEGAIMDSVWSDIPDIYRGQAERLGYPTQKPVALLERIIKASSNKGDLVLDPFCGCGTALIASQKLGRDWIGIDVSPTACKLMKKRLQKECYVNAKMIKGEVDMAYVKKLESFEFQNWVVVDKFLGTISPRKSGDFGIDGTTPQVTGGYPIQVKQSEDVGRNVVDNFQPAMDRVNKHKGYIVAFSFVRGAYEEAARVKNQGKYEIILRTVQELLDGKTE
jgi:DNA modification methylase